MSIDHHIAVNRPLSYTRLMSPRRTTLMISIFVALGVLLGFGDMVLQAGYTVMVVTGFVQDPWFADNQFCDRVDVSKAIHTCVYVCVFVLLNYGKYIYIHIYIPVCTDLRIINLLRYQRLC